MTRAPASTPSGREGIGLALAAALLFGVTTPLAKLLLAGGDADSGAGRVGPQLLAGLLYLGSGLGLGLSWALRRGFGPVASEAALSRRDLPWLAGAVGAGGIAAPLLLLLGLERTPASSASLLLNLEGVFTVLLAWLVFGEHIGARLALGMAAILGGGALLGWPEGAVGSGVVGPVLIGAACLAWAVDNNLTQRIAGADPLQTAAIKGLVAGSINIAIAAAIGATAPPGPALIAALGLGLAGYGASLVCYLKALRVLGTARTGAYFSVAPFVGAALAAILWHEAPTPLLALAALLMCVGVWIHVTENHEHLHRHEPLFHTHAHVHDDPHHLGHEHGPDDPAVTDPLPHVHAHRHLPLVHIHAHYPDLHHRHGHDPAPWKPEA